MKIALATGNYKNVVGHPGRCKGFIVYEIEDGKIINKEERENTFQHNHEHGHNHNGQGGHGTMGQPIAAMLQDCDYFIAKSMGQGFVNQLQKVNVKPAVVENINDAETAALQLVEYLKSN
ncbi:dinitrogenase iron-molybdenum cofactor [bacterium BMS3Abin04]|nr:dinitrogenase iron-molybdenum cofactor [bacterium BMS3Abin04]